MLSIIVVGGSIGGLMAGISMKRLGHSVTIFERSPTKLLHDRGAGIVVGGETLEYFTKHDRTHTPLYVRSPFRHNLDREGGEASRSNYPQEMTSWDLLYHILRANFDGLETPYVSQCPVRDDVQGEYRHGHAVEKVEREDGSGKVKVFYKTHEGEEGNTTADMVIAADGSGGTLRKFLLPEVVRTYAGYVAWRGTVVESKLSDSAKEALVERFTFYHAPALQMLSYLIPGENGSIEPGKRKLNWVWYNNIEEGSELWNSTMMDTDGVLHNYILPLGKVRPEILEAQLAKARALLPPQFSEIVHKTDFPFIQTITDVICPKAVFFDGQVVLLGDSIAGFRPHTAASTSQAAMNSLLLETLMKKTGGLLGKREAGIYEQNSLSYAQQLSQHGIRLGNRSQFGEQSCTIQ